MIPTSGFHTPPRHAGQKREADACDVLSLAFMPRRNTRKCFTALANSPSAEGPASRWSSAFFLQDGLSCYILLFDFQYVYSHNHYTYVAFDIKNLGEYDAAGK